MSLRGLTCDPWNVTAPTNDFDWIQGDGHVSSPWLIRTPLASSALGALFASPLAMRGMKRLAWFVHNFRRGALPKSHFR